MRYVIFLILVVFIISATGFDSFDAISDKSVGTRPFAFLRMKSQDPVILSFGGIKSVLPDKNISVGANPALLPVVNKYALVLTYSPVILDINSASFLFKTSKKRWGNFLFEGNYISYGIFNALDSKGDEINITIKPYSFFGAAGWANSYFDDKLFAGLKFKVIYERLAETAESWYPQYGNISLGALALDVGAVYFPKKGVCYSVFMENFGGIIIGYNKKLKLPLNLRAGICYNVPGIRELTLLWELYKPFDDYLTYKIGAEYELVPNILFLRGASGFTQRELKTLFDIIGQKNEDNSNYQKTEWMLFTLGFGFQKKFVNKRVLGINTGTEIRINGIRPQFSFSVYTLF